MNLDPKSINETSLFESYKRFIIMLFLNRRVIVHNLNGCGGIPFVNNIPVRLKNWVLPKNAEEKYFIIIQHLTKMSSKL
jgi:hypothetical protein